MGESRLVTASAIILTGLLVLGCGNKEPMVRQAPQPPAEPWSVSTNDPSSAAPAWLSNGLVGLRIGRDGAGSGDTAFLTDEYETEEEQKIVPLQNPFAITVEADGDRLDPRGARDYAQRLDFRTGVLTTQWTSSQGVGVESSTVLDPDRRVAAQRWRFKSRTPTSWRLEIPPARLDREIATNMAVSQTIVTQPGNTRETVSSTGLQRNLEGLRALEFTRVVRWPVGSAARAISLAQGMPVPPDDLGPLPSFEEAAHTSRRFWGGPDAPDIEIDGPVTDQQAIRSFLFAIRSAVHPRGMMAIAPMGLSSTIYHGHVFWDADLWVFPALLLVDPDRAAAISRYRLNLSDAAARNFVEQGRREGMLPVQGKSLRYPWQSSVTGIDVATPLQNRAQIHVTGSVLFALQKAAAFGLVEMGAVRRAGAGAADFYLGRSVPGPGGERELLGVMSPDEFAEEVNNDLYTNVLAQWCVDRFRPGSKIRFKIPRSGSGLATYDRDDEKVYKQAAAVLAIYPLQYPLAEAEAASMLDRFANKITPNGPAMADAVHALVWARIGQPDRALDVWRRSWMQYTNHPLMLFSEKKSRDATVFVTGAGGCLQTVLYGFLGLRIDRNKPIGAAWMMPLRDGYWLSARPNLPKEWRSVTLKNFTVLGKRMTLTVAGKRVQVTQGVP